MGSPARSRRRSTRTIIHREVDAAAGGTFIYHTHWHEDLQLSGGLYGPLIVLEPGERYDPGTDHIVIIGLKGVPMETSGSRSR